MGTALCETSPLASLDMSLFTNPNRAIAATALTTILSMPGVSATDSSSQLRVPRSQQDCVMVMVIAGSVESATSTLEFSAEEIESARREIESMSATAAASFFDFESRLGA